MDLEWKLNHAASEPLACLAHLKCPDVRLPLVLLPQASSPDPAGAFVLTREVPIFCRCS